MWTLRVFAASLVLIAAIAVIAGVMTLPPQDRPFARLNLEDPVGAFTAARLARLRSDSDACMGLISLSRLEVAPTPDISERGFCRLDGAVTLARSAHPYSQTPRMSCALAAALYVWEREVVAEAARAHLGGAAVSRIETLGAYSCRRIYGRAEGRVSFHATGDAIDIAGFRLSDGRLVSVRTDWGSKSAEGQFLRAVRDGGCRVFRAVLSPEYNAAHADHFHLDVGDYAICE
ncbi:MAG: hypothetical protein GC206_08710 [Alphaproteobacteria bacterium]|nr:hypothetical protein [Alphaproteobacteria bacterium]